jgi:hypothetical protein
MSNGGQVYFINIGYEKIKGISGKEQRANNYRIGQAIS